MPRKVNKGAAGSKRDEAIFPPRKERGAPPERRIRLSELDTESGQPVRCVERAALYFRVSSKMSAASDLSIPDQQAQLEKFCRDKGWLPNEVITMFDEYHSKRLAVDSMRARRRMVMEGYWPGGRPPYGYKVVPADDNPRRKVLALAADESQLVQKIFSFVRCGDGSSAPMGVQAIAVWLNDHGFRNRDQSRWSSQAIHRMLTNSVYYGIYYWCVSTEPLPLHVPPTITREEFDEVQQIIEKP